MPGRHEPLVDDPTWELVQQRLDLNLRTPSRTKAAAHSLAGLLRCGRCGGALYRRPRKQRGGTFVFCAHAAYGPESACVGIGYPALGPLEDEVLRQLADRVRDLRDTSADLAAREAARSARATASARGLVEEIAKTERALGVLGVKLAEGVLSDTAYRAAASGLEEALARLRARASEAAVRAVVPSFAASADLAAALLELWPDMTSLERNAALRTHVRAVTVAPAARPRSREARAVVVDWTY